MCWSFCQKPEGESNESTMERGEWLMKTSQWIMIVGFPICIHHILDSENWGLAVVIASGLGILGCIGFNGGIKMRDDARKDMHKISSNTPTNA